jgi:hypothetical protein
MRADGSTPSASASQRSCASGFSAVTAYAQACDAWRWWAFPGLLVACDRPTRLYVESAGDRLRPHRADGPAIEWSDGTREHWWHGTAVPAGVLTRRWGARRIGRIRDEDVRRAAIDCLGWPEFIQRARLELVSVRPDPGNPGRQLWLYRQARPWPGRPAGATPGGRLSHGRRRYHPRGEPQRTAGHFAQLPQLVGRTGRLAPDLGQQGVGEMQVGYDDRVRGRVGAPDAGCRVHFGQTARGHRGRHRAGVSITALAWSREAGTWPCGVPLGQPSDLCERPGAVEFSR